MLKMEEGKIVKKFKHATVRKIPTHYRVTTRKGYREFESEEEAIKWAKELSDEIERKKRIRENEDLFKIREALFIEEQIGKYIGKLKKDLWYYRKYEGISEEEAKKIDEIRKILKKIIEDLTGIYNGKLEVVWHESYVGNSTYYTLEPITDERIKNYSFYNKILEKLENED